MPSPDKDEQKERIFTKCFLQSWNGNYDDGSCCLKNNMFIRSRYGQAKPDRTCFSL